MVVKVKALNMGIDDENEIFIKVSKIGSTYQLDRQRKHNLISPLLLSFLILD